MRRFIQRQAAARAVLAPRFNAWHHHLHHSVLQQPRSPTPTLDNSFDNIWLWSRLRVRRFYRLRCMRRANRAQQLAMWGASPPRYGLSEREESEALHITPLRKLKEDPDRPVYSNAARRVIKDSDDEFKLSYERW